MNGTPRIPLKDLASLITKGTTPKTLGFAHAGSGIPFLRAENIRNLTVVPIDEPLYIDERVDEALRRSRIQPSDVLISIAGTIGRVGVVPPNAPPMNCNQAVAIIRLMPALAPRYLAHWLTSIDAQRQIARAQVTATISNLSLGQIGELAVPLPPLAEQRRIVDILDKADAIRRKRKEAIALTEELLRSAFLEMFGDPVTNPKGWPMSTFAEQLELLEYGPRFYNEKYSDDGTRIVRITDLEASGALDFSSMPRLLVEASERERYALRPGDLIFARTGATVGKTALIEAGDPEAIPGAYFIRMRFKKAIAPRFARQVLANEHVQQVIASRSRQSAQQNFSGPGIRELPLPTPPRHLQDKLEGAAQAQRVVLKRLRAAQEGTERLFDSLVDRAFKGELTSRNGAAKPQLGLFEAGR